MNCAILSCAVLLSCSLFTTAKEGATCTTPNYTLGKCVKVRSCRKIIDSILTRRESAIKFARKSQCGYADDQPLVCCDYYDYLKIFHHRLLPELSDCGNQYEIPPMFAYGEKESKETHLLEHPWMALLRYLENGKEEFRCGGTLISKRYVLTAAHCTKLSSNINLIGVRLGEHNISSPIDCDYLYRPVCSYPVVDLGIERVINYPNYKRSRFINDISLIRLDENVYFSDFIRPICLPAEDTTLPLRSVLSLVGWGETQYSKYSDVKMRVDLPVANSTDCGRKLQLEIQDSQFCAGGMINEDSCKGDSGGPLLKTIIIDDDVKWIQEGIVSYGLSDCGIENFPGVYTRVSKYVRWIVENMCL